MKLGTTYICVSNMQKSLNFYKALLQKEPLYSNDDRWITFECENVFSLYNKSYDEKLISKKENDFFNQAYIDEFYKDNGKPKNNMVVFNFEVDNLKNEYKRLESLDIGEISELMYVNVHMPYWYFNITDPDGNICEITGPYE